MKRTFLPLAELWRSLGALLLYFPGEGGSMPDDPSDGELVSQIPPLGWSPPKDELEDILEGWEDDGEPTANDDGDFLDVE